MFAIDPLQIFTVFARQLRFRLVSLEWTFAFQGMMLVDLLRGSSCSGFSHHIFKSFQIYWVHSPRCERSSGHRCCIFCRHLRPLRFLFRVICRNWTFDPEFRILSQGVELGSSRRSSQCCRGLRNISCKVWKDPFNIWVPSTSRLSRVFLRLTRIRCSKNGEAGAVSEERH